MGDTSKRCDLHFEPQIPQFRNGFTLLEMMVALAVCGTLAAISIPVYTSQVQRAKVSQATADIAGMMTAIGQYRTQNGISPPDLETIGYDSLLDPWNNPYTYLSFTDLKGKGKMRKDKNLNPLNTQYDLYSMGADGQSKLPLTVPVSRDDVILAFDGNYIGLASSF